jgi:exodeoxyribonuclease VII large subunit
MLPARDVYTVTRLNSEARAVLEGHFPALWVEGEVSNLARPRSGHLYFSLKDRDCQVRCAMFRMFNRHLGFELVDGGHVLVHARVSLYPERGDFQLLVEYMEEAGAGALRRAFDALKQRLAAEGLFDAARKKPLPAIPRRLGVITSPTGAAVRDILSVLERRFPALPVLIYPVPVQGPGAAGAIARAIALADRRAECDVLVLARGGGSLEDLWPFNEEIVARAIYACRVPIVTGVGHEIDFTIADFAADQRGATPSAAAELVTPDQAELRQRVAHLRGRLQRHLEARLRERRQTLLGYERRIAHPRRRLFDLAQRIDGLALRLSRAVRALPAAKEGRLRELYARLQRHDPALVVRAGRARREALHGRLRMAGAAALARRRTRVDALQRTLQAMGPLRTLERGYAIVTTHPDGHVLRSAQEAPAGTAVRARLAKGSLVARVESTEEDESP